MARLVHMTPWPITSKLVRSTLTTAAILTMVQMMMVMVMMVMMIVVVLMLMMTDPLTFQGIPPMEFINLCY